MSIDLFFCFNFGIQELTAKLNKFISLLKKRGCLFETASLASNNSLIITMGFAFTLRAAFSSFV
jgi:hypothetical protein